MIHRVLKAYLGKKTEKRLSSFQWEYMASVFAIIVVLIVLSFIDMNETVKRILQLITAISGLVVFSIFEKKLNQMWKTDYIDYEKQLADIRKILSVDMKYKVGGRNSNWYSEKKIDHLVEEGKKWIEAQDAKKNKSGNFAHIAVLPVIAFFADILKESISSDEAIATCAVVLMVIIIVYFTDKFLSMIFDMIVKTASVDQMAFLVHLLQDLKVRDFSE